jgi:hypothetical protein
MVREWVEEHGWNLPSWYALIGCSSQNDKRWTIKEMFGNDNKKCKEKYFIS